jgi:hypothetical protein
VPQSISWTPFHQGFCEIIHDSSCSVVFYDVTAIYAPPQGTTTRVERSSASFTVDSYENL